MSDDSLFIECECHSPEHDLRFNFDLEDKVIYTTVFLDQYRSWYERIWIAIKYIFGYKCQYGHFDCTLMGPDQVDKLQRLLKRFEYATKPQGQAHSCDIEGCAVCDPSYGL